MSPGTSSKQCFICQEHERAVPRAPQASKRGLEFITSAQSCTEDAAQHLVTQLRDWLAGQTQPPQPAKTRTEPYASH